VWAADDELFHMEPVVFRLTAGRLECLSFLGTVLCHTHLAAPQMEGWSYNELNPNCLYVDTKAKENVFLIIIRCYLSQISSSEISSSIIS
jgi:hypothetical protein